MERLDKAGLTDDKVKGMTDLDLQNALQKSSRPPLSLFQPDWVAIVPRLSLPGVTAQSVYDEYLASNPGEKHKGRSTFYLEAKRRIGRSSPEARRQHEITRRQRRTVTTRSQEVSVSNTHTAA